jgi:hypothetical protein
LMATRPPHDRRFRDLTRATALRIW